MKHGEEEKDMMYICKLASDLDCNNRLPDNIHCNNNVNCGFCVEEAKIQKSQAKGYVRKERWYEKYYKN